MTPLQRVAKEDLEEGQRMLVVFEGGEEIVGVIDGEYFVLWDDHLLISEVNGQFYGPIELETE